jgi:hypothetical protein
MTKKLRMEKKMKRLGLSLQHLLRYVDEGDTHTLNGALTREELWVHH